MKVYISNYRHHWLSPYTIIKTVIFWREVKFREPLLERVYPILAPVCSLMLKVLDFIHPQVTYVKIDAWDVWSMDSTLAPIIVGMLKKLREDNFGAAYIDDKDLPIQLRGNVYDHSHAWRWVLTEIIWAFQQYIEEDWEEQYYTRINGKLKFNKSGLKAHSNRMKRGTILFGKYYGSLWS